MSKRISLGVVGCGNIVRKSLLPVAAQLGDYEMRAFMDVREASAAALCAEFGGLYHTTDLARLLNDSRLDAVIVATYPDTHVALAKAFLEADKHVFVQKPLGTTYADCRQIVQAERAARSKLMTAYCYRLSPLMKRIRAVVPQPRTIYARMMTPDLAQDRKLYLENPDLGPPMLELACHNADLVYWLAQSMPARVSAFGGNLCHPGLDVIDNFTMNVEFENGTVANLINVDCGSGIFEDKWYTEVYGQGITAINNHFRKLEITGAVQDTMECAYKTGIGIDQDMVAFRDCILGDVPSPIPASEGIVATVLLLKAFESLNLRKVVEVNLSEYLN